MNRYALFLGHTYYPVGGWDDFEGTFTSVDAALEAAAKHERHDWFHVVDLSTGKKVAE